MFGECIPVTYVCVVFLVVCVRSLLIVCDV